MYPTLWQGDNILMVIDGKQHVINKNTHPRYMDIVDAMKNQAWDTIPELIDNRKKYISFSEGNIKIENGALTYNGYPLHESMCKALDRLISEGLPYSHFTKFIDNLMQNSSSRSIQLLYGFLEKYSMPITEDGCFLAYKAVEEDFYSSHKCEVTGEAVRYMVGDKPSMPRFQISDDPNVACHRGLHACSFEYLQNWNGHHLMMVKVNPKDVVCIPYDCNHSKMRVCEMEVISEIFDENGNPWYHGRHQSREEYDVLDRDEDEEASYYTADEIEEIRRQAFEEGRSEGYSNGYDEAIDENT